MMSFRREGQFTLGIKESQVYEVEASKVDSNQIKRKSEEKNDRKKCKHSRENWPRHIRFWFLLE